MGFFQRERREVGFRFWVLGHLGFSEWPIRQSVEERQKKKVGLSPLFLFFVSVDLWLLFYGYFSFVQDFSCFCCLISPFWVDLFCGFFSAFEITGGLFCNSHKKGEGS